MNTIPFFLTLGLAILVLLLATVAIWGGNRINDKRNQFRWVYFVCFVVLALAAVGTVRKYLYPKDERVFRNTDYHVIEHKGFVTDSVFCLVRGQFPQNFFPEQSLWDGKSGLVELRKDSILVADYCEPFFVEVKNPSYRKEDSLKNHRGNTFVLVNKTVPSDIGRDGLLITRESAGRTDTLYRLAIVEDKKEKETLYISSTSSRSRRDTSQFKKTIARGYPLSEIIGQTPGFEFGEDLQDLFEGTMLLHERIPITNNFGGESTRSNDSPLLVFPGSNLYFADDVRINGAPVRTDAFTVPYRGETMFYSGMGRTKTDVYKLAYQPEDQTLSIRYALPKMQKLKPEGGRLFIASSVETILDDPKEGGYYYNILDNDNNFNHIDAEIRYRPGSAREKISFEVMDVYSPNPGDKIVVTADNGDGSQDFPLSVKAKSTSKTKWIFDVKDLRESNPLQSSDIVRFIVLFLFLVGLRLLVDGFVKPRTLTIIELCAYVVVFCLCVVRLIIGWRASTFVPIEDISAAMFYKMRSSILNATYPVLALPVIMLLISLYKPFSSVLSTWRDSLKIWLSRRKVLYAIAAFPFRLCRRIKEACIKGWKGLASAFRRLYEKVVPAKIQARLKRIGDSAPHKDVVFYYALSLLFCFIACRGPLVRLMNIPIPLILYILFDYWLVCREMKQGLKTTTARVIIALLAFGYLFVKDAGFTVIFFVFLFLYHAVVGTMANGSLMRLLLGKKSWKRVSRGKDWPGYLIGLLLACLLFLFLKYEGNLMIWAFNNIRIVLLMAGAAAALLFLGSLAARKREDENAMMRIVYAVAAVLLLGAGIYESVPGSSHFISEKVNSKVHMKFRAEIQKLREGERIDDLIERSGFKSTEITYIMRSAHNQWFINQYLKAGERLKKEKRHFILQPHSNQGSSYTTQTTDLVVTRYVLAEHGNKVVILFMLMLLVLILSYAFEVNLLKEKKRAMLEPVLLLFVIGLMVFLSATNRIVFVGQDFPFISLQSRVAILFPTTLLLLAIISVAIEPLNGSGDKRKKIDKKEWTIATALIAFSICCVAFIPQQGKMQNETQFDVSRLINSLSEKVDMLDKSMMKYQLATEDANKLQKDTLWSRYSKSDGYSRPLNEIMQDPSDSNRFCRSLIEYFSTSQAVKNDPEELLHMRKRNGYWHLALNKKHFFIPSMLEEGLPWRGDLLAAKTTQFFTLKDTRGGNVKKMTAENSYVNNILPARMQKDVENVQISQFDASWGSDGEPILLINSHRAIGSAQYFHIESTEGMIEGSSAEHQIATRIDKGDLVMVRKMEKGEETEVLGWRYGMDSDNYLAKNIWMNGRQKLFYPLGKESMWSYQFANAVSTALGKSEEYRDSSVRVSIDSDLHEAFYKILNGQNKARYSLKLSTIQQLQEFEVLPLAEMQNIHNVSNFYFDTETKTVKYKKRANQEISRVLNLINRRIAHADPDNDRETQISNAIAQVTERNFDFSAVVLDGNGRIRLLFDHTRSRNVDPNNIRHFNKFMSDMYKNGDNRAEQDVFGNKALQTLPSGPGSSFKPIAYTAVTSRQKIAWEQLDVLKDYMGQAQSPKEFQSEGSIMYDYYGGVYSARLGQRLSIDSGSSGYNHNDYLIRSNNLYHSVVILLGMQQQGELEKVFKPAGEGKYAFPVISYKGERKSFDPDVWFRDRKLDPDKGVLNDGLLLNFRLKGDYVSADKRYTNFYGDSPLFSHIYENAASYKGWSYPETGSQNVFDRRLEPILRNGFNQMFLGAYPLEVTPLQMATMGMRLASLNRTPSLTTLDDEREESPEYSFFEVPTWQDSTEYFRFFQRQVLTQMRQVPRLGGTASALAKTSDNLLKKGYYIYAKTGTLNDQRPGAKTKDRLKHLLVLIADRPLENVSFKEFKEAKYYVLYLSYIGISSDGFSTSKFKDMIDAVTSSELFKEYMEE